MHFMHCSQNRFLQGPRQWNGFSAMQLQMQHSYSLLFWVDFMNFLGLRENISNNSEDHHDSVFKYRSDYLCQISISRTISGKQVFRTIFDKENENSDFFRFNKISLLMKSHRNLLQDHFKYAPKDHENREDQEGQFIFVGEVNRLPTKLSTLTPEDQAKIKKVNIIIAGQAIKQGSECCKCLTCICGCALCFPFLFTCCQWWKRMTSNSFQIPLQTYRLLQKVIESPNIQKVTLVFQDNTLGAEKAAVLINSISKSKIKWLKLINLAGQFSYGEEDCYGEFQDNFSPLEKIENMKTFILWSTNVEAEAII